MAVYGVVYIASTLLMYGYLVFRDKHRQKLNKLEELGVSSDAK